MNKTTKFIAVNAILAAMYAALTVATSAISYNNIQFRVSEILIFLAFFDIRFIPGLILGCVIANFFSPLGIIDVAFGTAATVIAVFGIWAVGRATKKADWALFIVPFIGSVANGLIVALELKIVENLPFWLSVIEVAAGEFAVLMVGAFIFLGIRKVKPIKKILSWEW